MGILTMVTGLGWVLGALATGSDPGVESRWMIQDTILAEIRQLRNERKFEQAREQIRSAREQLDANDFALQVQLELELMKCETSEAFERPAAAREAAYRRIIDPADDFLQQNGSNPNGVLIEVQKALTALRFGELIRKELEAGLLDPKQAQQAWELLRSADRQLEKLDGELELRIPGTPRKTVNDRLDQRQLISLQNQVRYQMARSKINRALLYGDEDPENRVATLATARQELQTVIPLLEKVDPTWWEARRELVMCLREVGELAAANQMLLSLPWSEAEPEMQLQLRAETLRLLMALREHRRAEQLIAAGRQIDGVVSPEFDFAILEYFLNRMQSADESERREDLETAVGIVRSIEQRHGAYWGKKSNLALVNAMRNTAGDSGAPALIRLARDSYQRGEFAESIQQFERAADAAGKAGDRKLELELRFQSILIHREQQQHQQVYQKTQRLAEDFQDTPRSAAVHLAGILSAAELVRAGKLELSQYLERIDHHLETWANHYTVGQVAFFRGNYESARKDWLAAAASYQMSVEALISVEGAIDLDRFEQSMSRLIRALEKIRDDSLPESDLQAFRQRFDGPAFFGRVRMKTSELESTLNGWACYALEIDPTQLSPVLELLQSQESASGRLRVNVIRAAFRLNRQDEVQSLVDQLVSWPASDVELLLDGWRRDWKVSSEAARESIARAIANCEWTPDQRIKFRELLIQGSLKLGDRPRAIGLLQEAVASEPRDIGSRQELAELLAAGPEPERIEQGLAEWRTILEQSPRHSDAWYAAKYGIISCHWKLGRNDKARTILDLLKAIPPGWEKSKLADKFSELDRQLPASGDRMP